MRNPNNRSKLVWSALKKTFHYRGRACRREFLSLIFTINALIFMLYLVGAALFMTADKISLDASHEYSRIIESMSGEEIESSTEAKRAGKELMAALEKRRPFETAVSYIILLAISIYALSILPLLSSAVRRVHDVGHSGWLLLIPFMNIFLLLAPGMKEENRFGPNPRTSCHPPEEIQTPTSKTHIRGL